jgi:putative ABC transport system substrate-binding protein
MKRREFLRLTAAAAAWPAIALAEETGKPTIGYLSTLSEDQVVAQSAAFRRGLGEAGFVEGKNIAIESRWAEGQYERLPAMARELVDRGVSLILAQAPPAALAARAATAEIPVVFVVGLDPVAAGLVASLNRPGSNATGMTLISPGLGQKRLEIVRELLPKAASVGLLVNPLSPDTDRRSLRYSQARGRSVFSLQCSMRALRTRSSAPSQPSRPGGPMPC